MVYFPKGAFSNILEYCDDRVEQKQRYLWSKIKPGRFIKYELAAGIEDEYIWCNYVFYDELSGEAYDKMGWVVYEDRPRDVSLDVRWDDCVNDELLGNVVNHPHFSFELMRE